MYLSLAPCAPRRPGARCAGEETHPAKLLAVDTDGLNAEHVADGITHYGGQIEFVNGIPGAPVPLPVFGAGAYRSPLLEPGCGCFQHAWVIAEPRFWQLGDPPLHMNVIRGHLAQRDLLEMGAPPGIVRVPDGMPEHGVARRS